MIETTPPCDNDPPLQLQVGDSLPAGWTLEERIRQSGKYKGSADRYYHHTDGTKLRSLPELNRYLFNQHRLKTESSNPLLGRDNKEHRRSHRIKKRKEALKQDCIINTSNKIVKTNEWMSLKTALELYSNATDSNQCPSPQKIDIPEIFDFKNAEERHRWIQEQEKRDLEEQQLKQIDKPLSRKQQLRQFQLQKKWLRKQQRLQFNQR